MSTNKIITRSIIHCISNEYKKTDIVYNILWKFLNNNSVIKKSVCLLKLSSYNSSKTLWNKGLSLSFTPAWSISSVLWTQFWVKCVPNRDTYIHSVRWRDLGSNGRYCTSNFILRQDSWNIRIMFLHYIITKLLTNHTSTIIQSFIYSSGCTTF